MRFFVGTEPGAVKDVQISVKESGTEPVVVNLGAFDRKRMPVRVCMEDEQIVIGYNNGQVEGAGEICLLESSIVGLSPTSQGILACSEKGVVFWGQNKFELGIDELKVARPSSCGSFLATGGKERDLVLWDMSANGISSNWKAKNVLFVLIKVKNDKLDLRQPVWINDIRWINNGPHELVTATEHAQIRLYDIRNGRRPSINFSYGTSPIRRVVCQENDEKYFFVVANESLFVFGSTTGELIQWDKRAGGQVLGKFKGITGSITDIAIVQDKVACTGLDRFLRIYDVKTRQPLHKVYLKQRLTCLFGIGDELVEQEEEEEEGDLWEELENVESERPNKKSKFE